MLLRSNGEQDMLSINEHSDNCIVTWQLSNVCNFSWSYCPEYLHNGSYKYPDDITNVLRFFKKLSEKNKSVYIEILGEKPTLWSELISFLSELKKLSNVIVEINTNGSRSEKFWKKYCSAELEMIALLSFSCHSAFCEPNIFYKNLEIVSEKHNVVGAFMLYPKHFARIKKLFEKVKKELPVDCHYRLIRDCFHPSRFIEGYNEEMLEALKKDSIYDRKTFSYKKSDGIKWYDICVDGRKVHWQSILFNKGHKFKNWKCAAGNKRFFINFNGDVWPCSLLCRQEINATDETEFYLGNIYNKKEGEGIQILDEYISCPKDYCACKADAATPKYAPDYERWL